MKMSIHSFNAATVSFKRFLLAWSSMLGLFWLDVLLIRIHWFGKTVWIYNREKTNFKVFFLFFLLKIWDLLLTATFIHEHDLIFLWFVLKLDFFYCLFKVNNISLWELLMICFALLNPLTHVRNSRFSTIDFRL